MNANPIQMQPEYAAAQRWPDWFDEIHDPILILQDRDCEENGLSPQRECTYVA